MFHNASNGDSSRSVLQVELNTIASSFGCLSNKISDMHKQISASSEDTLPENFSMVTIASALIAAHREYVRQTTAASSAILFVIQVFMVCNKTTHSF